jgi:prepilin-type N-terminal cleavage/methylation domain-containing protein
MRRISITATARRPALRQCGITLPEMLIAMVIMTLIAGVVSATYFTSLHIWRRCSSMSQAEPPAHISVDRLCRELKNAYLVDSIGDTSVTFTLPKQDENGINVLPLEPAQRISYYLSDDTGKRDKAGTHLWRERLDVDSGSATRGCIAENVESLKFSYDATEDRVLKIYAMSITVIGEEGKEQYHSEFESHVAFRN